ncbi:MAG TPA: DUF1800 domain-containing protein [Ktedonobacterales bacterium]
MSDDSNFDGPPRPAELPREATQTGTMPLPDTSPSAPPPAKWQVSRRAVVIGATLGAVGMGAAGAGVGAFLLSHQSHGIPATLRGLEESDAAKINHLLRRAGFGPSPADIGEYLALGVSGALDHVLNYASVADDVSAKIASLNLDLTNPAEMMREWILRMIYSKRPLEEKMALFWHGVLVSSYRDVGGKTNYGYMRTQNKLFRTHALGRFDDLMYAVTTDPAMLRYLNGAQSTGSNPNENYARELMELFTLGIKDANGNDNYSQDDVHQGALALTGWTIDRAGGAATFVPQRHYAGSVTYLGHTGSLSAQEVVRIVCAHPATGRHLAFRLWSFFVAENPSEADLKPVADAYYSSNHSIAAMVRAMFTSSAFTGQKAYRARIKSPAEFVVGAVRALGLETDGKGLTQLMSQMGQTLYDPPNVSGWDGDKVSAAWLNTTTWMQRLNFINSLVAAAAGLNPGSGRASATPGTRPKTALENLVSTYQLESADDLVSYVVAGMVDNQLASERVQPLRDALSATHDTRTLTLPGGATVPLAGVRQMLYLLMAMPEYQMN